MSTPIDNPAQNTAGKNHNLGCNITICSNDDESLLFHRTVFGLEPSTSGGQSSASASGSDAPANHPAESSSRASNLSGVSAGLPASLFFTPVNKVDPPMKSDEKAWSDTDDEALRALLMEAIRGMEASGSEGEVSTQTILSDPAHLYWLFNQCRTVQGSENIWIKTENVDWEKVAGDNFRKHGIMIDGHRLKMQVDHAFRNMGITPSSDATAMPQAEAGPSKAAGKRKGVFAGTNDAKRGRPTGSRMSVAATEAICRPAVQKSPNRAPIARMEIHDSEVIRDNGRDESKGILREDNHTNQELESAAGLLELSTSNHSSDRWAADTLLQLGKSLRWSLPMQTNGQRQARNLVFKILVTGEMRGIGGLQPRYTRLAAHLMSCTSGDVAGEHKIALIDRDLDVIETLRDAPAGKRTLIVSDSERYAIFLSFVLEKIQKRICIPGTSTWPKEDDKLFPLLEELDRRVKNGQEVRFAGVVRGRKVMKSPFTCKGLGAIDFEVLDVIVQAARD